MIRQHFQPTLLQVQHSFPVKVLVILCGSGIEQSISLFQIKKHNLGRSATIRLPIHPALLQLAPGKAPLLEVAESN